MSRRRYHAFVEVDRDDQVEDLVRLAADAEIGLTILGPDDGEHPDLVSVVDVSEHADGTYVFAERSDAERFADAVDHDRDDDAVVEFHRAFVDEQPLNVGAAAERLIAAERSCVLGEVFGPALAADVREGRPLAAVLEGLREVGEDRSDAAAFLRRWIELDERTGGANMSSTTDPEVAGAPRPPAPDPEPAYTVVGCHGRGGGPYVTTVHTYEGPEVALDLAHDAFAEDRPPGEEVELEIVAIFHGGPELVDFDAPEPGGAKGGASR